MIPLAVTVGAHGGRFGAEARRAARAWGLPFLERPAKGGVAALLARDARACLVLSADGWALRDAHGSLAFSPGLAMVRLKRLAAGRQQEDVLVRLGELKAGDTVVDATLGLAADALVCARAVGPTGRVVGIEASLPLWILVSEGLARQPPFPGSTRVEAVHGSAREVLATWPTGGADVVTLDPMFDRPKKASPTFELLRAHAVHEPLDEATLREARRVARRWVVVKGGRYGHEFRRLQLQALPLNRFGPVVWARAGPLGA
ncbi:MAG: class I SAM-dependent methyltransferase [Myxococcota bacterium]